MELGVESAGQIQNRCDPGIFTAEISSIAMADASGVQTGSDGCLVSLSLLDQ